MINYEPSLTIALDEDCRLQCRMSVDTRTTGHLSRSKRSVYKAAKGTAEVFRDAVKLDGADAVRARIGSAAAKVGRPPNARGGGNGTKRLRFYVDTNRKAETLEKVLAG